MNPDQLDQQSIDSLFGGETDKTSGVLLDFSARRSLTGEQMGLLTALTQPIVQSLTFQLSAWLDADITMAILAVERQLCQNFLSAQDMHGLYMTQGIFTATDTPALLCIDLTCADVVAHYGLGGLLEYKPIAETRAATLSDMALLDSLLAKVWTEANQIWAACGLHAEFDCRVLPTGMNKVFAPSDNLLIFTYVLTIAGVESSLQLCLPSTVADRLLKELHLRDDRHVQPTEVRELVVQRLGQTSQKITLRLPCFSILASRLDGLRAGDVVNTGISSSTPAELSVRGGAIWHSRPSKFDGGRLGAQIIGPLPRA